MWAFNKYLKNRKENAPSSVLSWTNYYIRSRKYFNTKEKDSVWLSEKLAIIRRLTLTFIYSKWDRRDLTDSNTKRQTQIKAKVGGPRVWDSEQYVSARPPLYPLPYYMRKSSQGHRLCSVSQEKSSDEIQGYVRKDV